MMSTPARSHRPASAAFAIPMALLATVAWSQDVAPPVALRAPVEVLPAPSSPASQAPVAATTSREPAPLVLARLSQDPTPTLSPQTFTETLRAADRYRTIVEAGGWPTLPVGTVLKPGDRSPAVLALRRRLAVTEDLDPSLSASPVFDDAVLAAVRRFQVRHGLPDAGLVARRTVEAMNVPAEVRQRQLSGSAGRLMGSSFAFGERYVVVNVPSAAVEAVERGVVARRYVAVVGKPDRATPTVETRVTNINFNPTWTVPVSLIRKDIIPHVRKDPGYLAKMHIRLLDGQGQEVEPARIDWSTEKAVNYTVRQDPGFDNSLGQVRIDMPNRHAVYMHDTPSKNLFTRDARFHSSGCVRVADVKDLAGWLLEGTPGPSGPGSTWGRMEIETGIATGERRDLKLGRPVPVTFVYLTGYATPDGTVHFRDDVYGLDVPAGTPVTRAPEPRPAEARVPEAKPSEAKSSEAKPIEARPAGPAPAEAASTGSIRPPGPIPNRR